MIIHTSYVLFFIIPVLLNLYLRSVISLKTEYLKMPVIYFPVFCSA